MPRQSSTPSMIPNPLGEVFGIPPDVVTPEAQRDRAMRLCPFNNNSAGICTKNDKLDPLGVCSVIRAGTIAITCPSRFRQRWLITEDAANFFFPNVARSDYSWLTEVRLYGKNKKRLGNLDMVVVRLDHGQVVDYGALEVQAVYVSQNVSKPFRAYMRDQAANAVMDWPTKGAPHPDFASSSRKRLAPQLLFKGAVLNSWGRKIAVALDRPLFTELRRVTPFATLPDATNAEVGWFVYDLQRAPGQSYQLTRVASVYSDFANTMQQLITPEIGDESVFLSTLQDRVNKGEMYGTPPDLEAAPEVDALVELPNDLDC